MDIKNLEEGYELICAEFPNCQVGEVHGKMKPAEKDAEMQRFVSGETQIMVATTVIEVGVNVPNASVMVIENANVSDFHNCISCVGVWDVALISLCMSGHRLQTDRRNSQAA